MSCDYASGLSAYADKGICGQPEHFDAADLLEDKITRFSEWVQTAKHIVVITGAGISTSAGIPDFRGPKGVWTLEQKGEKPNVNISFDDAVPTVTHMALVALAERANLKFLVSQNVDGLHLRSGFPPEMLTDLHGNMFVDRCNQCGRQFIRVEATKTVGQKPTGEACSVPKGNGRLCRGQLHDSILDWEDELPAEGLQAADLHCKSADLIVCLGTTLQIVPCGTLPLHVKKTGGRIVICNLQPTKIDKSANLILRYYVDDVMKKLMDRLNIKIPAYSAERDPTKQKTELPLVYPRLKLPVVSVRKRSLKRTVGRGKRVDVKFATKVKKEEKGDEYTPAGKVRKRERADDTTPGVKLRKQKEADDATSGDKTCKQDIADDTTPVVKINQQDIADDTTPGVKINKQAVADDCTSGVAAKKKDNADDSTCGVKINKQDIADDGTPDVVGKQEKAEDNTSGVKINKQDIADDSTSGVTAKKKGNADGDTLGVKINKQDIADDGTPDVVGKQEKAEDNTSGVKINKQDIADDSTSGVTAKKKENADGDTLGVKINKQDIADDDTPDEVGKQEKAEDNTSGVKTNKQAADDNTAEVRKEEKADECTDDVKIQQQEETKESTEAVL